MMPLMIYEFKIVLSVWVSKKLKNRHATRFSVVFWWLKWSSEPQFAIFPGASRNPVHVGSAHPKAGTAIPYWRVKLVNLGAPAIFSGSFHFKSPLVIKHGLGSSVSLNGVSVSWENPSNFCQLARFHTRRAVPRPARFLILTALAQKQKWNKLWRAQEKPSMIWGGISFWVVWSRMKRWWANPPNLMEELQGRPGLLSHLARWMISQSFHGPSRNNIPSIFWSYYLYMCFANSVHSRKWRKMAWCHYVARAHLIPCGYHQSIGRMVWTTLFKWSEFSKSMIVGCIPHHYLVMFSLKHPRKDRKAGNLVNMTKEWQKYCHLYQVVGGIPTPLKNMSSSVGNITFPIYGKPPTRYTWFHPLASTSRMRSISFWTDMSFSMGRGPKSTCGVALPTWKYSGRNPAPVGDERTPL